jgi:hypothetical protein
MCCPCACGLRHSAARPRHAPLIALHSTSPCRAHLPLRLRQAARPAGQAAGRGMQSAPGSVSSDPPEADSLRHAWSCPLSEDIFQVEPQGPEEEIAGLGVAIAFGNLLSEWSDPVRRLSSLNLRRSLCTDSHVYHFIAWQGWLPDLFDERLARLTGVGAATPSFPFVEMLSSLEQQPPQGVIHQFVMVLVSRLHMSVPEIVMAYALVS